MPVNDGGLGTHLIGDKINVGQQNFLVTQLLGEGGFSYIYLVKELSDGNPLSTSVHKDAAKQNGAADDAVRRSSGSGGKDAQPQSLMVLKITSIHSRSQRDIAEKEAKLLSRLSHPSIIKMYDTCYRSVAHTSSSGKRKETTAGTKERPQHVILMEYCEGGHALDVCSKLASNGQRFDLSTLIIAFGQICNAVSYLHAQRPPIVHRDLKPVNFLVKNGAYKLCDFGSAVFGHVDLKTQKARAEAEEVIEKTTTQMFRSPEMVDLYMAKKLTQATDVWALGSCLYQLAFLQNCFEEGSNLAILSRKYTIPEDNPYGEGLVELLDRMLTVDSKARADMTEVILCLSAVYSGRPLPPRKKSSKAKTGKEEANAEESVGTFRTDGQGIQETVYDPTKATVAKKLSSNSVAARRKRAAAQSSKPSTASSAATAAPAAAAAAAAADPLDFSSFQGSEGGESGGTDAFGAGTFGEMKGFETTNPGGGDFFGSFDDTASKEKATADGAGDFASAFDATAWGDSNLTETADAPPDPDAAEPESQATPSPVSHESIEVGLEPAGELTVDGEKKDSADSQRKERSRRRRPGTERPKRPDGEPQPPSVEGLSLNAEEGGEQNVSGDSAEKKERKSRRSREDDEHRRKRSSSRSRRKARGRDNRTEKPQEETGAKTAPNRTGSIRGIFGKKPEPPPDP